MLRARSTAPGLWETFTLHTYPSPYGGLRTGTPTDGSSKIDYIFGPQSASYQCRVNSANTSSDHKPIYATITIP